MLDGLSHERRDRFFVADGASFVIAKEVRELCVFSPHSVIRDPPFSRIDLVSCRNLLIYFGAEVQGQVIPTFHYALRPDGYLFLGTSENVSQFDNLFDPVDKKHRIFQRRANATPPVRLPAHLPPVHTGRMNTAPNRTSTSGAALRHMVDGHVLDRFAPPHVLVTREGDVVYYSGRTGKYLEAASGAPTRQLVAMTRKGLGLELRTAFRESVESGRSITREGVAVESEDGRVQIISLTVEPLPEGTQGERLYLVVFADQGPVLTREEAVIRAQAAHDGTALHVEKELRDTRERLQSSIEEYETALEELKSSNEELVSVNEELQSSNEELEASKELVASALSAMLQAASAHVIGPCSTVAEALSFIADGSEIDAAILDVDLHGEKSYPVAQALLARRVRFVFATGYGEDGIEGAYRTCPCLQKPVDGNALVKVLLSARPE